jgi:transcriptional regulator with XRE-family HTH domain
MQTCKTSKVATSRLVNDEALFRKRLRQLALEKYGSLDRFYLETEFSKGHLSQVLRGKRSPSLATMIKLAKALNVKVAEFFLELDGTNPALSASCSRASSSRSI